jgi:hypothetical protein
VWGRFVSTLAEGQLSVAELDQILTSNLSLRGFLFGYVAEHKLRTIGLADQRITNLIKYDNHDRTRKGDVSFTYAGAEVVVEVKSLQTDSIRQRNEECEGRFQCDASDRREVLLPNGERLETTCLLVGEFDLVAVNVFGFGHGWRFLLAKNRALARTRSGRYTPEQRQYLLATLQTVTWPPKPPFTEDLFGLLDELAIEKQTHDH